MKCLKFMWFACALYVAAPMAQASEETELLRQQIKALEMRLEAIEKKEKSTQATSAISQISADKASAQTPVASSQVQVKYDKDGISISSPGSKESVSISGYVQADSRIFINNSNVNDVNQFVIRTVRPNIEAQFGEYFSTRLQLDFGGSQTRVPDAYVDITPSDALNFRIGKFKPPMGVDRLQSRRDFVFIERGTTSDLLPFRDMGVMAYGDILPDQLSYQLALTNGVPNTIDVTSDSSDGKDVSARLLAEPFADVSGHVLKGLGVAVAGSYGHKDGTTSNTLLGNGLVTIAQSRFFSYTPASGTPFADGKHWRLNPHAYYYHGPLGFITEYVREGQELRKATQTIDAENHSWMAQVNYLLTGEDATYKGITVARPFDPAKNQWGALELAMRYGEVRMDDALFPIYSNLSSSARAEREMALALNWYLNDHVKINTNAAYTQFDGGASGGRDREDERVILTRTQFSF